MPDRQTIKTLDRQFSEDMADWIVDAMKRERPGERVWRDGRKVELRTLLGRRVVIDVRAYDVENDE